MIAVNNNKQRLDESYNNHTLATLRASYGRWTTGKCLKICRRTQGSSAPGFSCALNYPLK
jgi:hypothetical protein